MYNRKSVPTNHIPLQRAFKEISNDITVDPIRSGRYGRVCMVEIPEADMNAVLRIIVGGLGVD